MGYRQKAVCDSIGLIMQCLGEEPKGGQGRGLGDLWKKRSGNIERYGDKRASHM